MPLWKEIIEGVIIGMSVMAMIYFWKYNEEIKQMATINSREMVDKLISNEGFYEDDRRVVRITEYTNAWGKIAYGLEYDGDERIYGPIWRYAENIPYVTNPKIIFEVKE